jgi:hypothetical protein
MESVVLEGARGTLSRCRPHVFFEVLTLEALENARTALSGLDYKLYWVRTQAFNRSNFNRVEHSIFALGELAVLAVPEELSSGITEYPVSSAVAALPERPVTVE